MKVQGVLLSIIISFDLLLLVNGNEQKYPESPLDEDSPLGDEFISSISHEYVESDIDECSSACSNHLNDAIRTAIDINTNIVSKYVEICKQYDLARTCRSKLSHCRSSESFDVLTSGLNYMCVEMREAFDAVMPCVNEEIDDVRAECDLQCNTNALVHGMLVKKLLENDLKFLKMLDPHMMKITMSEACRVGECLLQCYKTKLNLRCEGSAGFLISETLVRPFDSLRSYGGFLPALISLLLPPKCSFLTNSQKMARFRISPQLEEDLKRVFANRKSNNKNGADDVLIDPWKKFEEVDGDSPLQNGDFFDPTDDETFANDELDKDIGVGKNKDLLNKDDGAQTENHSDGQLYRTESPKEQYNGAVVSPAPGNSNKPTQGQNKNNDGTSFEYESDPNDPYLFVRPIETMGSKDFRQDDEAVENLNGKVLSTSVIPGRPYNISLNFTPKTDGELVCSISQHRRN